MTNNGEPSVQHEAQAPVALQGTVALPPAYKHRAAAAIFPLWVVTVGVYFFVWIYKIHAELRRHLGNNRSYPPGLAMGLMFIPLFNYVWLIIVLYKVATLTNEILAEKGLPPKVSSGGILALLIIAQVFNLLSVGLGVTALVSIPLLWIASALVQSGLNHTWRAVGNI